MSIVVCLSVWAVDASSGGRRVCDWASAGLPTRPSRHGDELRSSNSWCLQHNIHLVLQSCRTLTVTVATVFRAFLDGRGQRRRWLKKLRKGQEVCFSNRQQHVSDTGDYGCWKFQLLSAKFPKVEYFQLQTQILYFGKIFQQLKNFWEAKIYGAIAPCSCATGVVTLIMSMGVFSFCKQFKETWKWIIRRRQQAVASPGINIPVICAFRTPFTY